MTSNQIQVSNNNPVMLIPNCEGRPQLPIKSQQVSVIKRAATVDPEDELAAKRKPQSACKSNSESSRAHKSSSTDLDKQMKIPKNSEQCDLEAVHNLVQIAPRKSPVRFVNNSPQTVVHSLLTSSALERSSQSTTVNRSISTSATYVYEGAKQIASDKRAFQEKAQIHRPYSWEAGQGASNFRQNPEKCVECPEVLSVIKPKQTKTKQKKEIRTFSYEAKTVKQTEVEDVYKEESVKETKPLALQTSQQDEVKAKKTGNKLQRKKAQDGKTRRNYSRMNAWNGPSYTDLITNAIRSAPDRKMIVAEIYEWLIQHVPYFNQRQQYEAAQGWKNAVRHTLSLRRRFVRIPKPHSTTPWYNSYWTINEKIIGDEGDVPPRRRMSDDGQARKSENCSDIVDAVYSNTDCSSLETDSCSSVSSC